MQYLLVIIATPVAVWLLDRIFYRGELAEVVVETMNSSRAAREKSAKARRAAGLDQTG